MPTTVTVNSNFQGLPAGEIIGQIFKQANTIGDNLINVIPNVVGSGFLRKTYVTDGLADYSCGFSASGAVDLTEVEITPKKLKVNIELCKETFRSRWSAAQMGFSAWNNEIPADEKEAIMLELSQAISAKIDSYIWTGVAATNGQFGGLIPQFVADATVVDVVGVVVTSANVVAQLGRAIDAQSDEVLSREDFVFGISKNVHRAYVRALGATAANFSADNMYFDGYKLTVINGLPANTMVLYPSLNVSFLTGLESDTQEVRIKDMDESDLSGTIRVAMVFTAGVGYADGSDIVLYKKA